VVRAGPRLVVPTDHDALEEVPVLLVDGEVEAQLDRMLSTASGLVTLPAYMRAMSEPVNFGIRKKMPKVTMLMMISSSAEVTNRRMM